MGARAVAFAMLALVACERTSKKYCELHGLSDPQSCGFMDAPTDTPKTCTTDTECAPARCNTMAMQCVQCLTEADCPGASPFCDPQTNTCGACRTNADCADSGACLPDGQCAAASDVVYANGTTGDDGNPCTLQQPCKTITHALTKVTTTHSTLKLSGSFNEAVAFLKSTVTILADPGTTLASGGTAFTFMMTGSNVQVFDLEIAHTTKSAAIVPAGNKLTLTRVDIHDCGTVALTGAGTINVSRSNIHANPAGGILLSNNASFQISNNFIHHNGSDATAFGGVSIGSTGQSTFEFNTVVDNDANTGGMNVGGIVCTASGFHAPNNIIARNALKGDVAAANANVSAASACDFTGSVIQTDVASLGFVDPDTAFDYHIGSASTAKDASTVPSLITEDIDSQARPYGPAKDLGADEYHP